MYLASLNNPGVLFYLSDSYSESNTKPEVNTQPKQVHPLASLISGLVSFLQLPRPQAHLCAGVRWLLPGAGT